jgi:hypothetical protein
VLRQSEDEIGGIREREPVGSLNYLSVACLFERQIVLSFDAPDTNSCAGLAPGGSSDNCSRRSSAGNVRGQNGCDLIAAVYVTDI